jgi:hypothetical protein
MNPADSNHRPLPHYGTRDEEKTRPYVVLFDWDGDEEATVHVRPVERGPDVSLAPRYDMDDIDDIDVDMFRPRWHGIGRRPGTMALAVVLGVSFTIGAIAMLGAGERQAAAADASSLLRY